MAVSLRPYPPPAPFELDGSSKFFKKFYKSPKNSYFFLNGKQYFTPLNGTTNKKIFFFYWPGRRGFGAVTKHRKTFQKSNYYIS